MGKYHDVIFHTHDPEKPLYRLIWTENGYVVNFVKPPSWYKEDDDPRFWSERGVEYNFESGDWIMAFDSREELRKRLK